MKAEDDYGVQCLITKCAVRPFSLHTVSAKIKGEVIEFEIEGMHCTSCVMNIDGALEDEVKGVISSKTSYAKAVTVVEFDPDKVNEKILIKKIEKSGYQVV